MNEQQKEVNVRRGAAGDVDVIARANVAMAMETENLTLDMSIVREGVRQGIEDPQKAIYWVAECEGRVVGQLMVTHEWSDWRNGDIWWIESVYVEERFRKRGVFRALFEFAEEQSRVAGAVGLRLYVERENERAQTVYSRLGMAMTHYQVMEKMWNS